MTSSIRKIRKYGFEPIAWGVYACEETFIFKTKEEARLAHKKMEDELELVQGWWYGEDEFNKYIDLEIEMGLRTERPDFTYLNKPE